MLKKILYDLKENSSKRIKWLVGIAFFSVLFFILFSDHGLIKRFSLEAEKSNLSKRIQQEYKTKDSLNSIIKKLRNDTLEIERIAREKYGMVKSGEEVYYIKSDKK